MMVRLRGQNEIDVCFRRFCETGEEVAFERVYLATCGHLLRAARRELGDAGESLAEDFVHTTFVTAIEARSSFDARHSVRPWLLGILRHRVMHWRRRRRLEPELDAPDVIDPRAECSDVEAVPSITAAIERLPSPYREVVQRRFLDEQLPADIARDLGRGPSTVRSQIARGVRMLRRVVAAGVAGAARALGIRPAAAATVLVSLVAVSVLAVGVPWQAQGDQEFPQLAGDAEGDFAPSRVPGEGARVPVHSSSSAGRVVAARAPSMASTTKRARALRLVHAADGRPLSDVWLFTRMGTEQRIARTDASGLMSIPDRAGVEVVWPAAGLRVAVGASSSDELFVAPGFRVEGTVRYADGGVCAGATIVHRGAVADLPLARCDSDGRFVVRVLEGGANHSLYAEAVVGSSQLVTLVGSPGQTVCRDFEVERERVVPSREPSAGPSVNPERPGPIALSIEPPAAAGSIDGWVVQLVPRYGRGALAAAPIRGGIAHFDSAPDVARCLLVHPRTLLAAAGERTPSVGPFPLRLTGAWRVLDLRACEWPTAWIDMENPTDETASVAVFDEWGRPTVAAEIPPGERREFGPLPSGPCRIATRVGDRAWSFESSCALADGQRRQLVLSPSKTCSVSLRLVDPRSRSEAAGAVYTVCARGIPVLLSGRAADGGVQVRLVPDRYEVFATAPGFACVRWAIDVRSGAAASERVASEAMPRVLEFVYAEGVAAARGRAQLDWRALDAEGSIVWRERSTGRVGEAGLVSLRRALPPSARQIEVSDSRGWFGVGRLAERTRIELRGAELR